MLLAVVLEYDTAWVGTGLRGQRASTTYVLRVSYVRTTGALRCSCCCLHIKLFFLHTQRRRATSAAHPASVLLFHPTYDVYIEIENYVVTD